MTWESRKLSELTSKIGSGATPRGGASVYTDAGVTFIRSQNVLDNSMKATEIAHISDTAAGALRGVSVHSRDVLINITGDSIARCCVVEDRVLPARVNQHVAIVRSNEELDPRFLQKVLVNPSFKEFLIGISSGGTRKALTKIDLENLEIPLPPLAEQQAIAEVLGALDDKIAANTKLIDTCEALQVALLEPFPATVPLSDLVSHRKTTLNPQVLNDEFVAQYSLPAFDVDKYPSISSPHEIQSTKFLVEQPSVLISKLNPRFPRVWDVGTLPNVPALASTEFLVLAPKAESTAVVYAMLSQPAFAASLETQVSGTSSSHQRVKPADILATCVASPEAIPSAIKNRIAHLGSVTAKTRSENRTLAQTRDALLPQLMSGKLRVKDAETTVSELL